MLFVHTIHESTYHLGVISLVLEQEWTLFHRFREDSSLYVSHSHSEWDQDFAQLFTLIIKDLQSHVLR